MNHYVLGFLFSPDQSKVVLIRKNRPNFQAGQYNGVGGKIEKDDLTPQRAMEREFFEETGLRISTWGKCFSFVHGGNAHITVFRSFGPVLSVDSMTDEQVQVFDVLKLPDNIRRTARYLLHMALDENLLDGGIKLEMLH